MDGLSFRLNRRRDERQIFRGVCGDGSRGGFLDVFRGSRGLGRSAGRRLFLFLWILLSGDPTGGFGSGGCLGFGLGFGGRGSGIGGAGLRAAEPLPVFPTCLRPSFRSLYVPDAAVGHPALLAAGSLGEAKRPSGRRAAKRRGRPVPGLDYDAPTSVISPRNTRTNGTETRWRWQTGIYAHLGFIPENKKTGIGGALSFKRQTFGLHYEFEGFSLYHTHSAGLSYAAAFSDHWQGGVFVRYRRRNRIEDRMDKGAVESGLSVAYRVADWDFSFKAAYEIPLQGRGIWQQALGLLLTAAYRLSDDLSVGAEVGKDIRYPVGAAVAAAYRIKGHFMVFGLCGIYPLRFSLGGGYTAARVDILVSTAYQPPVGATGQISLSWKAW